MLKKLRIVFLIAFLIWICYIIKTKIWDLIVGNYILTKKIEKYEKKIQSKISNDGFENTSNNISNNDMSINLFTLGSMYYDKLHNYEKACEYFQKIINDYPNCDFIEIVYFMIGDCYEKLGRIELAVIEYKKYLEKFPNGQKAEYLKEKLNKLEKKQI